MESARSAFSAAGVSGPLFISVGKPKKLHKFLELNPEVQRDYALVDTSDSFDAYKAAGFINLLGEVQLTAPPAMKAPKSMSAGRWFKYLSNVMELAPMPDDGKLKFGEVPPGVKVLGGTYVIDGDDFLFVHEDQVPGATPPMSDILTACC